MNTIVIDFPHHQSAHCESGVTSNLLKFQGFECSEALAFGLGEGVFFGYLPFIRVNKLPLTTYRAGVGSIFKKVNKRFGANVVRQKYKSKEKAMDELDKLICSGIPVGCQTGAYWLPYFPPAFRFHFNMHNLVVFGKEGDDYLISDPVFEEPVRCSRKDLIKARFAKGALAPSGTMYYIDRISGQIDMEKELRTSIKAVFNTMVRNPIPFLGIKGIRFLASRLEKWPKRLGEKNAILHLGQLIRMQEEIGTGGGGFRFMYAAFLQEAAEITGKKAYKDASVMMTDVGDAWRNFAVSGARICKGRAKEDDTFETLSIKLRQCAVLEKKAYNEMYLLAK